MYIITKSALSPDINECADNPCENGGSCTDAVNDYSCACAAGWTGKQCAIGNCVIIVACDSFVINYKGTSGRFLLAGAKPFFTLLDMRITLYRLDIDECASDPCVNGNCIDEPNGYTCSCTAGWTGLHCAAGNPLILTIRINHSFYLGLQ